MKLIVLDIDGVISQGEGYSFDLILFRRLAALNRRARNGEEIPAVTLNTGRPSPYVEAVMQAIGGWQPALYETGAGLYFPQTYRFERSLLFTPVLAADLDEIIARLDQAIVRSGQAYWQPGKTICHSLLATPPLTLADIQADVAAVVGSVSPQFTVTPAGITLNIHPAGINKGTGLHWLAQVTGIAPAEMGGVGDSAGDIDFLRLVGRPAVPANAGAEARAVAGYVADQAFAAGLHEILDAWLLP